LLEKRRGKQTLAQTEEHPAVLGLPIGSLEDKELTLAFQSGDKGAYQAIYNRYSDRVHRVCRRMLVNPQDAQEAAQESFLRIYQALGRFNGRYQLGAWITRITTNVCLDHLRSRARRPADAAELELVEGDPRYEIEGPETKAIKNAEGRRVRRVLAQLPPLHRAAIVLRDFEGLSYAEVAMALQLSEVQVKALIHRARQNFKRSWAPLTALLPWRLFGRVKEVDSVAREQVAQVATTTVHIAPVCTSALQQCGQYVAERVAPVLVAGLVGVAAGGAAVSQARGPEPTRVVATERAADLDHEVAGAARSGLDGEPGRRPEASASSPTKAPAVDPTVPAEAEEPPGDDTASPPAAPEPSPSPSGDPTKAPTPQPSATPRGPFMASVGFDWGRPIPSRAPRSHSTTLNCTRDQIEQSLDTVVDDDDSGVTFPANLRLHWGNPSAPKGRLGLELTVWKNGHEIYYSGTGDLVGGSYSGSERKVEFMGNYGTMNPEAKNMDLPSSGRFSATLTLDCAALSVITESVVLGS
jgi:RNA polymerase sigma-70 factor, ECF subfamily